MQPRREDHPLWLAFQDALMGEGPEDMSEADLWGLFLAGERAGKAAAERIALETKILVPFAGDHDRLNFAVEIARQMAEAIADRIKDAA